jgi:hypothetical protein
VKNRKILTMITVALAILLLLTACGEYNAAVRLPGANQGTDTEAENNGAVTDENGNVDENPFTVTLMVGEDVYVPSEEHPISVQWSDGFSVHTAPIGKDGVARVGGLDGDYRVNLTAIPEGYTYNPNVYTATNNNLGPILNIAIEQDLVSVNHKLVNILVTCLPLVVAVVCKG